ncbi:NodT family efflux transporter outer membrane factor (OMF) lipoprotein [Luteibacter sp. Sphag1AF]|uniref:TolC family protein n=1 Tax=Luteibacter sp. Sphag1AF TaxID=2587031 RepID=UPI00160BCE8E|nr:TolC family protein [Luteibacter sp. Sphag1AF]MBB3225691.1 NodT family efflux transporter outer membrane factor (OMF) lipoprotein [Luteibacter sp. Sphag1AF]
MRRLVNISLALGLLATSLVGCANLGSVTYPPPVPAVPSHWSSLPAPAPMAPDMQGWWKALGDPALDAVVERALANNLDVAQAVERLQAARGLDHHSGDRFLPSLRAKTEDAFDPDASASFFVAGFDAMWELGFFGRATGASRVARGELASSEANVRAARVTVIAEVVRQWIEMRAAQQRLALLQEVRDASARRAALTQVRADQRLASPVDVARAQGDLARASAALIEPRQAADTASRQLAVLLGLNTPDPAWSVAADVPELGAWKLDGAPAELLRTRPEIARAEADVLRMAGELGLARADMYPSIGLGASMIWSTEILSYRRTHTRGIVGAGPVIDIPLFDWGMRAATAHAKGHEFQAAVLAYRQSVLVGVAEVQTALNNLDALREREGSSRDLVTATAQADRAVVTRIDLKLASEWDRTESRTALAQANAELVDARATRDLAYVALFKALGGAPVVASDHEDQENEARR